MLPRWKTGLAALSLLSGLVFAPGLGLAQGSPAAAGSMRTGGAASDTTTCTGVLVARLDGTVSGLAPDGNPCASGFVKGSLSGAPLNAPVIGITALPQGGGYWLLAADGGVFAFGQAGFYGSTGSLHLNAPVVGMASTPDGRGYWLVASDGGIFSFGDAQFHGSAGGLSLRQSVVGMAPDQTTGGYWLVAADGGVFAYDAPFLGSMGGKLLNAPMRFMTGTPDYGGYRLVAKDGGVFNYGDASFYGSAAAPGSGGWSALAATPDDAGYWLFAATGTATSPVFDAFGDASPTLSPVSGDTSSAASVVGAATVTTVTVVTPPPVTPPAPSSTPPSAGGAFTGVSCGTTQDCVAVGSAQGGGALIERSTSGGASFTIDAVPSGAPAMDGVDCDSAAHCVAVGDTSAMVSDDGGASWTLTSTPAALLDGVACQNEFDCTAVGGGAGPSASIYSTDGGMSWANSAPPPSDSVGVTCFTTACVAAGEGPSLSTDGGRAWSQETVAGGTDGYLSVGCTGDGSCLAISTGSSLSPSAIGALGVSNDGGSSWTNESANLPGSTVTLQAIACAGSSNCLAVGPPPTRGGALVGVATTNDGSSWTAFSGPSDLQFVGSIPVVGITCTAASSCILVAANSVGPVAYTTTNAGQNWTLSTVD